MTHPRHSEIGHIGDLRWYRCPAPWFWASEYLLVRSQWPFQHHQGAWKLRPPEKCHQLGTSLGKTRVRGVSFITELTISIQHHLRGLDCHSLVHFYTSFQALERTSPLLLHPQNATSSRKTSLIIPSLPISSGMRWSFLSCNPGLFLPSSGHSRAGDLPPSRQQRMRTLEKHCHSNPLC